MFRSLVYRLVVSLRDISIVSIYTHCTCTSFVICLVGLCYVACVEEFACCCPEVVEQEKKLRVSTCDSKLHRKNIEGQTLEHTRIITFLRLFSVPEKGKPRVWLRKLSVSMCFRCTSIHPQPSFPRVCFVGRKVPRFSRLISGFLGWERKKLKESGKCIGLILR